MAASAVRTRQKERTRDRIVAAARVAFTRQGFEHTTIRDIASRAGVASGTVFVHFSDKNALLAHIFHDGLQTALDEAWRSLPATTLQAQLLHLAEHLYVHYATQPDLSRVLLKESLFLGGDPGRNLDDHRSRFLMRLEDLVRAAATGEESSGGATPREIAEIFFALYFSTLVLGLRGELGDVSGWTENLRRALRVCAFSTPARALAAPS